MSRNDLTVYGRERAWWDPRDPTFTPLHALVPAREAYLDRLAPPWQGARILDVGCGGGFMSAALAARGARVVGVDLAQGALRAAQGAGVDAALVRARADHLPFADGVFDGAVCTDVLVHVPDPGAVLREIGRVLRPRGLLHFSSINRSWLSRLVMITLGEDLLRTVHKGTHDPARFIRPEELGAWCAAAGLDAQAFEGLGPVGLGPGLALRFGRLPTTAVMYQGHAVRRA